MWFQFEIQLFTHCCMCDLITFGAIVDIDITSACMLQTSDFVEADMSVRSPLKTTFNTYSICIYRMKVFRKYLIKF